MKILFEVFFYLKKVIIEKHFHCLLFFLLCQCLRSLNRVCSFSPPNLRRVFPEHVFLALVRGDPEGVVVAAEVQPGRAGAGVAEEAALGKDVPEKK